MITDTLLDAVLLMTTTSWLALAAVILVDWVRYDRWTTRIATLRRQLTQATDADVERLAAGVTAAEFDQLLSDGVPSDVEAALARALLSGGRRSTVSTLALGATRADVWTQIRAAQILTSARADVVHYTLDRLLRAGDRLLAAAALRMLVRLDDRRSAEVMLRALVDDVHARSRIAAAFNAMSVERAETLRPLFASEDPGCRYWAARLACCLQARQWAPQVRELTADPDPFVRRAAVEAVGVIGAASDAETVLDLLSDPAPVVRAHAARTAATFSGSRIITALRLLLSDGAWIVRSAASEALARPPRTGGVDTVTA